MTANTALLPLQHFLAEVAALGGQVYSLTVDEVLWERLRSDATNRDMQGVPNGIEEMHINGVAVIKKEGGTPILEYYKTKLRANIWEAVQNIHKYRMSVVEAYVPVLAWDKYLPPKVQCHLCEPKDARVVSWDTHREVSAKIDLSFFPNDPRIFDWSEP